jgi:elongation factor G
LLDTPGYTDFVGEVISALRVADSALILVDSVAGAEVGTEIAMSYCDTFALPRMVVINKMNRDNANFRKALDSVQEISERRMIPLQIPWGEKADFKGVIDLLSMKAYAGTGDKAQEIPAEFQDDAETARMELIKLRKANRVESLAVRMTPTRLWAGDVILSGTYVVMVAAFR